MVYLGNNNNNFKKTVRTEYAIRRTVLTTWYIHLNKITETWQWGC